MRSSALEVTAPGYKASVHVFVCIRARWQRSLGCSPSSTTQSGSEGQMEVEIKASRPQQQQTVQQNLPTCGQRRRCSLDFPICASHVLVQDQSSPSLVMCSFTCYRPGVGTDGRMFGDWGLTKQTKLG